MLHYARDDTHYLLYIYDQMRLELWERGSGQPVQLQVAWQRSRDICLKVRPPSPPGPRCFALSLTLLKRAACSEEPRAPFGFPLILTIA